MIRRCFLSLVALMAGAAAFGADAPKKLLVVTVTTGFRHSSIETAEKVLAELGKSSGTFTVDYVQQPPGQPKNPGRAPEKRAMNRPKLSKPVRRLTAKRWPTTTVPMLSGMTRSKLTWLKRCHWKN